MKIEIEIPKWKEVKWVDNVLTLVDKVEPKNIMERIKTFDDACEWCCSNGKKVLVEEYDAVNVDSPIADGKASHDLLAYLKLRIICAALNEGWEPKFEEDEYRYYPWFYLYTQEEIDKMSDEERAQVWLWGGSATAGAYAGLGFSHSRGTWPKSSSIFSARLAVRSSELAIYFGRQFAEIWADYILIRRK